MPTMSLEDLSHRLRKLDFCMLSTRGASSRISSRPMSNNGDVDYDGDSWFFSYEDTQKIADIREDDAVALTFTEAPHLLGKPGIFIAIEGQASLIKDKAAFEEHWVEELNRWFPQGLDTPGIILIKVAARTIEYWDGEDNGTVSLGSASAGSVSLGA